MRVKLILIRPIVVTLRKPTLCKVTKVSILSANIAAYDLTGGVTVTAFFPERYENERLI